MLWFQLSSAETGFVPKEDESFKCVHVFIENSPIDCISTHSVSLPNIYTVVFNATVQ